MPRIIKNNLGNFLVILVIFSLVAGWIFSGFPRVWQNPPIPPKIQEAQAVSKVIILTSGTSWTVPADFDPNANTIEAIGGGGGSGGGVTGTSGGSGQGRGGGGGGGGGEYRKITNFDPGGGPISYVIGAAGTAGAIGGNGGNGGDTTWNSTSLIAKGGLLGAAANAGGAGGAGGTGGTGAGGNFNGGTGGSGAARSGTSGGGGGGGGGAGGTTAVGGGGTNGTSGSTGGAGGAGGAASGGGAGSSNSGTGGNGTVWTETDSPFASAGAGGGGGGGLAGTSGVAGADGGIAGSYGAGGGGGGGGGATASGGAGKAGNAGVIVITYTALVASYAISLSAGDGTISYGNVNLSGTTSTDPAGSNPDPQTFRNDSNVAAKFNIKTGNAINGTGWTAVATTPGSNEFRHSFATTTGVTWQILDTPDVYEVASSSVAISGEVTFYLQIEMPSASDYIQKDITVTVQAAAP